MIVTDVLENFTDTTSKYNWILKIWFKYIFFMWNNPKPAPEYQMGWVRQYKAEAAKSLQYMVDNWDIEKIILSHGDNIEGGKQYCDTVLRQAWGPILRHNNNNNNNNNM